ncbi:hypothetical protein [Paraburkholderia sp. BL10I2N1]|uniref:hypothetical protein n=1 Tax=Paraburkholderia sp. BL10I2N1 TaxID=1938796 RepID=UPI00106033EE|nr:hypothetical protein [Paraburkholderia sp. BL10I2N1]
MKQFVIVGILLLSVGRVLACDGPENRPGETIDVTFAQNSSAIDGTNMLALANWLIDLRLKYPILESSSVVGLADAKESNPKMLAEARAANVSRSLDFFGIHASRVSVIGRVYKPMLPGSAYEPIGTRAEVTLVPGCPNNCCDGQ